MPEARMELEMRIAELETADGMAKAERVLRALDPAATLRHDAATGIAHIVTERQTLDVEDALVRAGLTVAAATG